MATLGLAVLLLLAAAAAWLAAIVAVAESDWIDHTQARTDRYQETPE